MGIKVIPSNYPSIAHLPGSKLRRSDASAIGEQEVRWLTVQTQRPEDLVVVTEKVEKAMMCAPISSIGYGTSLSS